jgi:hypothetical protein
MVVILLGAVIGLLQLDVTQDYLANRIEQQVEETYRADLKIGDIDGFLPFQLNLYDTAIMREDSLSSDTLASVRRISSQIDVWGLLQNKLTITGFSVDQPRVWLRSDEESNLKLLERRSSVVSDTSQTENEPWLSDIEVVAPDVEISSGTVYLASATTRNKIGNLPQSFSITNINTDLFVDWSEQQRYLDIGSFSAETEDLKIDKLEFSGQLYSDQRLLEFNSFFVTLGNSQLVLNGEIEGANLLEPNFTGQFLASHYDLSINSDGVYLNDLNDFIPNTPDINSPLSIEISTEGTTDSLWIDRASVGMGESIINANGSLKNLQDRERFTYEFRLDSVNLQQQDISQVFDSLTAPQYRAFEELSVSGNVEGDLNSINVDWALSSPLGELSMRGQTQLNSPYEYQGIMNGSNLDISPFSASRIDTTALNFNARLEGVGITLEDAVSTFNATFTESRVGNINFETLELKSSLVNELWTQEYEYRNANELIRGSGWIDFSREEPPVSIQGNAENIDLTTILGDLGVATTSLNFDYNMELQGLNPNRIQGRANLDVKPSIIGDDTVRAHQFYMDLNSPDEQTRSFRLTSSLFDMNVSGQIVPGDIIDQIQFWTTYLTDRFKAEILMDVPADSQITAMKPPSHNVVFNGDINAKDLGLIKKYLPDFPAIETDSQINFNVNTDGTRLLVSAKIQADTLFYNQLNFRNSRAQLTASFRRDRKFSEFSSVDFETNVGALETKSIDFNSMAIDLAVKQDSVYFSQDVGRISDDARFQMTLNSSITDSAIVVSLKNLFLGNEEYAWINEGDPSFTYLRNGNIDFENFSFQNRNEYFRLQGTLSKDRGDSLMYILRDINLNRISDLIKGEVDFAGILNGTLTTRSLTSQPTIQGALNVNQFTLNDRLVGDVQFNSRYNPERDRFDTQINIVTDSTKYEDYLALNDEIGQNIRLDGYFVTPNPEVQQDSVYYFDADFRQIDMWVIALLVDNVFAEMEGQANGEGYITGTLEDFDFHADFNVQDVFAKPRFLNTNYFISGDVVFDRHEGVILDSLDVMDTKGGMGEVWGTIDLNDFDPITYLDLTLDMNRLQFLNSQFDPDVPFYGNVSGSGALKLTGSNTDLYLRTDNPLQLTSDSEVSIPLLEETELQETGKFIEFVDSFENVGKKTSSENDRLPGRQTQSTEQFKQVIEDMTFTERFDLDLQFEASNNITVNLIFDPVVDEVLTAQGTGQMRITMQDQDVQMFGRYNINNGDYQFVTGEIISRELELESGGTIIWEGPPDNARLDISAVYRARPNVATLMAEGASETQRQNGASQQVPIDLIVEVNGTLNSVENNYYFRLPTSVDLSSNSTLQYTVNQINRDEQQKLLQATSILLTGQFIPTRGTGSATSSLSQNLTRGSTVLNPLLSNQVISPLLSNQINALLNSDVSRLDIDFNLNAYNEVDLGIALRLYNDRLILRREGQITGGGQQSSLGDRIGDLNATYRIRRGLSLTAFHRQNQILNSLQSSSQAGDVTPSVDGIGLEAQLQFNTWQEFFKQVDRSVKWLLGGRKQDDDKERGNSLVNQEAKEEKK